MPTVAQLKASLKSLGITDLTGRKADLELRLSEAEAAIDAPKASGQSESDTAAIVVEPQKEGAIPALAAPPPQDAKGLGERVAPAGAAAPGAGEPQQATLSMAVPQLQASAPLQAERAEGSAQAEENKAARASIASGSVATSGRPTHKRTAAGSAPAKASASASVNTEVEDEAAKEARAEARRDKLRELRLKMVRVALRGPRLIRTADTRGTSHRTQRESPTTKKSERRTGKNTREDLTASVSTLILSSKKPRARRSALSVVRGICGSPLFALMIGQACARRRRHRQALHVRVGRGCGNEKEKAEKKGQKQSQFWLGG